VLAGCLPELLYCCPTKSGKTAFAALFCLTMILTVRWFVRPKHMPCHDLEQEQGRVTTDSRKSVDQPATQARSQDHANRHVPGPWRDQYPPSLGLCGFAAGWPTCDQISLNSGLQLGAQQQALG